MFLTHLSYVSMLSIVSIGIILSLIGYGSLCLRAVCPRLIRQNAPIFGQALVGVLIIVLLAGIAHCFVSINGPLGIFIILPGWAFLGLSPAGKTIVQTITRFCRPIPLALSLGFAFWFFTRGLQPVINYDSGLYHFNMLRWLNDYPIVPGLANLHGRLGFNQTYFLFASLLNFDPWFGLGRIVANSVIWLIAAGACLEMLYRKYDGARSKWAINPERLVIVSTLVALVYLLWKNPREIAAPTPDFTTGILQLTIFLFFCLGILVFGRERNTGLANLAISLLIAICAITWKLSSLGMASATIVIGIICLFPRGRMIGAIIGIGVLTAAIWLGRGYISSGMPLYPSTIGHIDFEWSVPVEMANKEADSIRRWARLPGSEPGVIPSEVGWLDSWFERALNRSNFYLLKLPAYLTGLMLLIIGGVALLRQKAPFPSFLWLMLVPTLSGILFWFFTAPDLRFIRGMSLTAPIATGALALSAVQAFRINRLSLAAGWLAIITINYLIVINFLHGFAFTLQGYQPGLAQVREVELETHLTHSNLMVFVPVEDDRSWDSPLPATPNLNEDLRLIDRKNMGAGFTVKPPPDD